MDAHMEHADAERSSSVDDGEISPASDPSAAVSAAAVQSQTTPLSVTVVGSAKAIGADRKRLLTDGGTIEPDADDSDADADDTNVDTDGTDPDADESDTDELGLEAVESGDHDTGERDATESLFDDTVAASAETAVSGSDPGSPDAEHVHDASDTEASSDADLSDVTGALRRGAAVGAALRDRCADQSDLSSPPVRKGAYTWDDYAAEYFFDAEGEPPTDEAGDPIAFDRNKKTEALGFDPDRTQSLIGAGGTAASQLADLVDERTVNITADVDEDAFFSTADGHTTLANRYDLEKSVPMAKKTHFTEVERYWVNKPYAFVMVFRSTKENEVKYYVIQPYRTEIETDLIEFLTGKLRTSIKYADESVAGGDEEFRKRVIVDETLALLDRYDLYDRPDEGRGTLTTLADDLIDRFGLDLTDGIAGRIIQSLGYEPPNEDAAAQPPIRARPEPAVLAEDRETLSTHQVKTLLYYLTRDFIGYERIDPIKYDINVEDISCDGYESPVFVYHSDYEQVITNIFHGTDELDDFVVKLAQRSGKGISKRRPQVDATLPDGSRAQLTLGREVSDHGTNYTIRQFNDVPFTPIDLINWKTFSLEQMAFLWLSIENHKSLIFAGGTASGKTTSLNAVSLFIPSNAKIVSIEDTREVELPQRNWIASVTRPSFSDDDKGDIDEFDLLEAALRQRPDYIVMGEIRGEEGRTAFQVMSTGHTTYTTFHADSVGEVLKRFTTDPINVSKTMFTALDLVSVQTSTRVQGKKVRRNKSLTEINHYDAENDEINVQDVFQWQAETDEFLQMGNSNTLDEIMFDRGWNRETLEDELQKRRIVLAYLIDRGLNTYAQVAATFQAFINDPETVLALIANDELERSLEDLREMESVLINVDRDKEEMVPRPEPDEAGRETVTAILEESDELLAEYRGVIPDSVADALLEVRSAPDIAADPDSGHETLAETARQADAADSTSISSTATDANEGQPPVDPAVEPVTAGADDGDPSRHGDLASDPEPDAGGDPEPNAGGDPEPDAGTESASATAAETDPATDPAPAEDDADPTAAAQTGVSPPVTHDSFDGIADSTPAVSETEDTADDDSDSAIDFTDPFGSGDTDPTTSAGLTDAHEEPQVTDLEPDGEAVDINGESDEKPADTDDKHTDTDDKHTDDKHTDTDDEPGMDSSDIDGESDDPNAESDDADGLDEWSFEQADPPEEE